MHQQPLAKGKKSQPLEKGLCQSRQHHHLHLAKGGRWWWTGTTLWRLALMTPSGPRTWRLSINSLKKELVCTSVLGVGEHKDRRYNMRWRASLAPWWCRSWCGWAPPLPELGPGARLTLPLGLGAVPSLMMEMTSCGSAMTGASSALASPHTNNHMSGCQSTGGSEPLLRQCWASWRNLNLRSGLLMLEKASTLPALAKG